MQQHLELLLLALPRAEERCFRKPPGKGAGAGQLLRESNPFVLLKGTGHVATASVRM